MKSFWKWIWQIGDRVEEFLEPASYRQAERVGQARVQLSRVLESSLPPEQTRRIREIQDRIKSRGYEGKVKSIKPIPPRVMKG